MRNEMKQQKAKKQRGATMIEYAIMVAVFSVGMIAAIGLMKDEVKKGFETVTAEIKKSNDEAGSGGSGGSGGTGGTP